MLADLRAAARVLSNSPLFALSAVGLLALALAANTVIFSAVDALLLRSLPVHGADRLVRIVTVRQPLGARSDFHYEEEFGAWKKQLTGFEELFAWSEQDFDVRVGEAIERARVHFVTGNFFSSLDATPALGRLTGDADDKPSVDGRTPVVLSYSYWQRRFAGDPGVVGRPLALEGHQAVIVGVSARYFNGLSVETTPDMRAPIGWLRTLRRNLFENRIDCEVAGRLRPNVAAEPVRQQAEAIWRNGWRERNKLDPGEAGQFVFEPAARGVSRLRTQFGGVLWLLLGGMGLLTLLVCANVAALTMARTALRRGELAVRTALGASRSRLVRQLLAEAVLILLGAVAVAAALALAVIPRVTDALPPVRDFSAQRLSLSVNIAPDWRVFGFGALISGAALLVFGLLPALAAVSGDLHPLLKEGRITSAGWRGRQALVALQVALCTLLLTGAGLTLATLHRLEKLDAGFSPARVVTFGVSPEMAGYNAEDGVKLRERLLNLVRELPEVESAAAASRGLMRGTGVKMTIVPVGGRARPEDFLNTSGQGASPEYFATMGIPWMAGRNFTGREDPKRMPRPVVVNQAFARRFSPERDVLGRQFSHGTVDGKAAEPSFEVIGLVGDAKYRSLREPFQPVIYNPLTPGQDFILHVRTRAAPDRVIAPMRRLLAGVDPKLSFLEVTTLSEEVRASLWGERVAAQLAAGFAIVASLISAAGLYALIAFEASRRRREIGIRVALGARPLDVVRLMFHRAAAIAAAGVGAGVVLAWALAPHIGGLLYEVEPRDLRALAGASAVAFLIAAAASLMPSVRAAATAPTSTLRQE